MSINSISCYYCLVCFFVDPIFCLWYCCFSQQTLQWSRITHWQFKNLLHCSILYNWISHGAISTYHDAFNPPLWDFAFQSTWQSTLLLCSIQYLTVFSVLGELRLQGCFLLLWFSQLSTQFSDQLILRLDLWNGKMWVHAQGIWGYLKKNPHPPPPHAVESPLLLNDTEHSLYTTARVLIQILCDIGY